MSTCTLSADFLGGNNNQPLTLGGMKVFPIATITSTGRLGGEKVYLLTTLYARLKLDTSKMPNGLMDGNGVFSATLLVPEELKGSSGIPNGRDRIVATLEGLRRVFALDKRLPIMSALFATPLKENRFFAGVTENEVVVFSQQVLDFFGQSRETNKFALVPMLDGDSTGAIWQERAVAAEKKVLVYEKALGPIKANIENIASSRGRLDKRDSIELLETCRQQAETIKSKTAENAKVKKLLEDPGLRQIIAGYPVYAQKIDLGRNLLVTVVRAFSQPWITGPSFVYDLAFIQFQMHLLRNVTGRAAANLYTDNVKRFFALAHAKGGEGILALFRGNGFLKPEGSLLPKQSPQLWDGNILLQGCRANQKMIAKSHSNGNVHYMDPEAVGVVALRLKDGQEFMAHKQIPLHAVASLDEISIGLVKGVVGVAWNPLRLIGGPDFFDGKSMEAVVKELLSLVADALDFRRCLRSATSFTSHYTDSASYVCESIVEIIERDIPEALSVAGKRRNQVSNLLASVRSTIENQRTHVPQATFQQLQIESARKIQVCTLYQRRHDCRNLTASRCQIQLIDSKIHDGRKIQLILRALLLLLNEAIQKLQDGDLLKFVQTSDLDKEFRLLLGSMASVAARVQVELHAISITPAAYFQTVCVTDTQNMRSDTLACSAVACATRESTQDALLDAMNAVHQANPSGPMILGLSSDGGSVTVLEKPFKKNNVFTSWRALVADTEAQTVAELKNDTRKVDSPEALAGMLSLVISTARIQQYFADASAVASLEPPHLHGILSALCSKSGFLSSLPRAKVDQLPNSAALRAFKRSLEHVCTADEVDPETGRLLGLDEAIAVYNKATGRNPGDPMPSTSTLLSDINSVEILEAMKLDELKHSIFGVMLEEYSSASSGLSVSSNVTNTWNQVRDFKKSYRAVLVDVETCAQASRAAAAWRAANSDDPQAFPAVKAARAAVQSLKLRLADAKHLLEKSEQGFRTAVVADCVWIQASTSCMETILGSFYGKFTYQVQVYVDSVAVGLASVILEYLLPCTLLYTADVPSTPKQHLIFMAVLEAVEKLTLHAVAHPTSREHKMSDCLPRIKKDVIHAIHHSRLIRALADTKSRTGSTVPLNESFCGPAIHPIHPSLPFLTFYDLGHAVKLVVKHAEANGVAGRFPPGILHTLTDTHPSVLSPSFHNRNPQNVKDAVRVLEPDVLDAIKLINEEAGLFFTRVSEIYRAHDERHHSTGERRAMLNSALQYLTHLFGPQMRDPKTANLSHFLGIPQTTVYAVFRACVSYLLLEDCLFLMQHDKFFPSGGHTGSGDEDDEIIALAFHASFRNADRSTGTGYNDKSNKEQMVQVLGKVFFCQNASNLTPVERGFSMPKSSKGVSMEDRFKLNWNDPCPNDGGRKRKWKEDTAFSTPNEPSEIPSTHAKMRKLKGVNSVEMKTAGI
ncbi:hypothetical protein HDU98_008041 [Podochytrium sp. JEL0797]|nr:hypothetical protein HDU98_008041 [Podochytrium sp. JEL0797]